MAITMGLDPNTTTTIPFSVVNSSYVYALEDVVLKDLEKQGMVKRIRGDIFSEKCEFFFKSGLLVD